MLDDMLVQLFSDCKNLVAFAGSGNLMPLAHVMLMVTDDHR